jgi:ribosomal protein S27AE
MGRRRKWSESSRRRFFARLNKARRLGFRGRTGELLSQLKSYEVKNGMVLPAKEKFSFTKKYNFCPNCGCALST